MRRVPADPAPCTSRAFVAEALADLGLDRRLVDDVVLLVSELVTNAIIHGRPPIELRLRRRRRHLLLEVDDGATAAAQAAPDADDEHGRGLQLVSPARRPLGHAADARRQVGLVGLSFSRYGEASERFDALRSG